MINIMYLSQKILENLTNSKPLEYAAINKIGMNNNASVIIPLVPISTAGDADMEPQAPERPPT